MSRVRIIAGMSQEPLGESQEHYGRIGIEPPRPDVMLMLTDKVFPPESLSQQTFDRDEEGFKPHTEVVFNTTEVVANKNGRGDGTPEGIRARAILDTASKIAGVLEAFGDKVELVSPDGVSNLGPDQLFRDFRAPKQTLPRRVAGAAQTAGAALIEHVRR